MRNFLYLIQKTLEGKGKVALKRELLKDKVGRIYPSGPLGSDIAIARIFSTDTGTVIQIVTSRIMPFLEVAIGGRVHDNESCSFAEFTIDEKGMGTGSVYAVTEMSITEEGTLQIRANYHLQPFRLVNIQKIN